MKTKIHPINPFIFIPFRKSCYRYKYNGKVLFVNGGFGLRVTGCGLRVSGYASGVAKTPRNDPALTVVSAGQAEGLKRSGFGLILVKSFNNYSFLCNFHFHLASYVYRGERFPDVKTKYYG